VLCENFKIPDSKEAFLQKKALVERFCDVIAKIGTRYVPRNWKRFAFPEMPKIMKENSGRGAIFFMY